LSPPTIDRLRSGKHDWPYSGSASFKKILPGPPATQKSPASAASRGKYCHRNGRRVADASCARISGHEGHPSVNILSNPERRFSWRLDAGPKEGKACQGLSNHCRRSRRHRLPVLSAASRWISNWLNLIQRCSIKKSTPLNVENVVFREPIQ
jgi:hypothetical protein